MNPKLSIIFARTLLLTCVCLSPVSVQAMDDSQSPYNQNGIAPPAHHDLIQGEHVEGHIAFLKAELGITPAQESLWEPVAAAMREDVRTLEDADVKASNHIQEPPTAIQYLENRVLFAQLRAQGEARFLTAFRPLYEQLSPHQRQIADDLLIPDSSN